MKASLSLGATLLFGLAFPAAGWAQDTWTATTLTSAPSARSAHSLVWTGSRMIVWGGIGTTGAETNTGGRYDPVADSWLATSTTGAPTARQFHTAVWTGSRMLVWGGNIGGAGVLTNTGGSYNPLTDTWAPISTAGAPVARQRHLAVWTGREMIVWSGDDNTPAGFLANGGRYDPRTDTWSPISTTGAPAGRDSGASGVWTGREYIVWGGRNGAGVELASGGRYDPLLDQWSPISLTGSPRVRAFHSAVWTGREMIAWGGNDGANEDSGDIYDPLADSWTPTPALNAPGGRVFHAAAWTGRCMLIYGGAAAPGGNSNGRAYDPALRLWTTTSTNGSTLLFRQPSVWTGRQMIVWGGLTNVNIANTASNEGGCYLPASWPDDRWSTIPTTGAPSPRFEHTAVWSGREMLIWGGTLTFPFEGAKYDPRSESWTAMTLTNAPTSRLLHTAVWTGKEMIVWGGVDGGPGPSDGGRYDPQSDTWTATSLTNAPSPRQWHTAVWTGREMIIWGGVVPSSGLSINTGARYDPKSDTWTTMTTTGAPLSRGLHTAVWTGSEMIVWGGGNNIGSGLTPLDTGARYDPRTDTWTPLTTTSPPMARFEHTAVWTGDRMLIWAGLGPATLLSTGARYDPVTDAWTAMATPSLAPREDQTAVWTGSEMIVWGGDNSGFELSGGRYVPGSDSWTTTTLTGAPLGRNAHTAVWTGSRMLIWGGSTSNGNTNTGAAYGGDDSPPVAGIVQDGLNGDLSVQIDTSSLSANWSGFSDGESGIIRYEWALGSSPGAVDIQAFTDVGTATSATATGLSLAVGTTYYATVRATNGDGRSTVASSDGVYIGDSLTSHVGCSGSIAAPSAPPGLLLFGLGWSMLAWVRRRP